MKLAQTVAPAAEPVLLSDARSWLAFESGVTEDDPVVSDLITKVREYVERRTNRKLITQTWTVSLDSNFPNAVVRGYASLGPPASYQFAGCSIYLEVLSPSFTQVFAATTDASGDYAFAVPVPADLSYAGLGFVLQAVVSAPSFPSPVPGVPDWLSNGVHLIFGCQ